MDLKERKKLLEGIKALEKLLEDINLQELKFLSSMKKGKNLQQYLQNLPPNTLKELKKLYSISLTKKGEIIKKLLKKYNSKNLISLLSLFNKEELVYIYKVITKESVIYEEYDEFGDVLVKLCKLGLAFSIKNNEEFEIIIPEEIKNIIINFKDEIKQNPIQKRIESIVMMCGVIKKDEMYEIYIGAYLDVISKRNFYILLNAICLINEELYYENNCYIYKKIESSLAKEIIKFQEKIDYKDNKITSDIFELYQDGRITISPIMYDLTEYLKKIGLDKSKEKILIASILKLIQYKIEFDIDSILEKIQLYLPHYKFTKYDLSNIIRYIIRIYHDTRLYKYRGFKAHEIQIFLTEEEIKNIETKFQIDLGDREGLRLSEIFNETQVEKTEEIRKTDDGKTVKVTKEIKKINIKCYDIRKNRKFASYLNQMETYELQDLLKIYEINSEIDLFNKSLNKENAIKNIVKNKKEILQSNLVTLSKSEFEFLKFVIKNNDYVVIDEENLVEMLDFSELADLIKKGLIYCSIKNGIIYTIHIPDDIIDIITEIIYDLDYKNILKLRSLIAGFSNAYGVISKENSIKILNRTKPNLINIFNKYLYIINYEYEYNYVISVINKELKKYIIIFNDNLNDSEVDEILSIQGDYKYFTYDEYLKLADMIFERNLLSYKKLDKYLIKYFKTNAQEAEEIIDKYIIEQQMNKSKANENLMYNVSKTYKVDDEQLVKRVHTEIFDMIKNISNQMPQWMLKGNVKTKEYDTEDKKIKIGKIGRNQLCPCGSKRKYKHCCGKNN